MCGLGVSANSPHSSYFNVRSVSGITKSLGPSKRYSSVNMFLSMIRSLISSQNAFSGPGEIAFKKLRVLLERVMLRRTKLERADDLGLPPRTVIVRRDHFSPEEKELYLSLFTDAKRQFSTYVKKGTLLNSAYLLTFTRVLLIRSADYSNIFSLITRMRQMVCLYISPPLYLLALCLIFASGVPSRSRPEEQDEPALLRRRGRSDRLPALQRHSRGRN